MNKLQLVCENLSIPYYKGSKIKSYLKFNLKKKVMENKVRILFDFNKNKIGFVREEN